MRRLATTSWRCWSHSEAGRGDGSIRTGCDRKGIKTGGTRIPRERCDADTTISGDYHGLRKRIAPLAARRADPDHHLAGLVLAQLTARRLRSADPAIAATAQNKDPILIGS